jgi:hypothetical protein
MRFLSHVVADDLHRRKRNELAGGDGFISAI